MVEFFTEYGLFLAKAVTVVVAILLVVAGIAATAQNRAHQSHKGEIRVTPLNEFFEDLQLALQHGIFTKDEWKAEEKRRKKEEKEKDKERKKHQDQHRFAIILVYFTAQGVKPYCLWHGIILQARSWLQIRHIIRLSRYAEYACQA